jgi:Cysteine-rich secretory protein family
MRWTFLQAIVFLNIICSLSNFPAFGSVNINAKPSLMKDNKQTKNLIPLIARRDSFENQVLAELNQVRANPSAYANWLSQAKRSISTMEGPGVIDEAIHTLRSTNSMPPLQHSMGMSIAARDHVKDQGPRGTIGHTDSNGADPCQRVSRYGVLPQGCSENVSYGMTTPQDVVRQLIVDDGVPNRGHRRIVLNPRLAIAGVACGAHARYQTMCVINYAKTFQDQAETHSSR